MSLSIATAGGAAVANRIATIRQRFEPVRTTAPTTSPSSSADPTSFDQMLSMLDGSTPTGLGSVGSVANTAGQAVVGAGLKYQGVPYLWGGTDPSVGLDCSGFVQRVFADLGIDLPRVSRDQARQGEPVASIEDARPGDLIAFGQPVDHIAIYVGDGKILHAPRSGEVVKISDIHRTPTAIRRIVGNESAGVRAPGGSFAGSAVGSLSDGGTPGAGLLADPAVARYAHLFSAAGRKYGIEPGVLAAVAKVESGGNPNAVSPAGARGLMQFMPATARGYGIDPLDPAQAIDGAARMLTEQRAAFGSLELALAAYNAGPGAVRRHGGIPPFSETQNYVRKVMSMVSSS